MLTCIGIVAASIGLKAFLLPNQFLDGGVTGISLLVSRLSGIDISFLIIFFNIPFLILGYKQITSTFAVRSFFAITGLAIAVHFIEMPTITDDKLLIAVFGGLFLGTGIGFAVRGGTVIDGTEILAIYLSKKTRTTIGTTILIFNVCLFLIASWLVNLEVALYSILTYLAASRTADYIIHGIEEYIGITIISSNHEEIRLAITKQLGYGVTIFKGKSGYFSPDQTDLEREILHTVVTRLELNKIHAVIDEIDDKAFVVEYQINDTRGGIIKKQALH